MSGQEQEASGKQKTKEIKPPPKALELAVFVFLLLSGLFQFYVVVLMMSLEVPDALESALGYLAGAILFAGPVAMFFLRKRLNIFTRDRSKVYIYDPRSHRFLLGASFVISAAPGVVFVFGYLKLVG